MTAWPMVALGEVAKGKGQYGVGLSSRRWVPEDPRYIRITDIDESGRLNSEKVAPDGTESGWDRARLRPGDLLFARSGATVGKTYVHSAAHDPAVYAGYLIRFELDPERALPEYVFRYTQSAEYWSWIASSQRAVAQPNINAKQYGELLIPLPPLPEQLRIAAILDHADALRAKRREALTRLDELTKSIFIDVFGDIRVNAKFYPSSKIGNVALQVTDGEHQTPKRTASGWRLLSARNVHNGRLDLGDVDYVGSEEYERISRRCAPSEGDLLISCSGSIGRVAIVPKMDPFCLVRSVALVRFSSEQLLPEFAMHYLQTPAMQALMRQRANASSQANLFQGPIRELPILLPPIATQLNFAAKTELIDALKSHHRSALTELDALFASLQSRAFAGVL